MTRSIHVRSALVLAALIVACSSRDEDGCGKVGERACASDEDCAGYVGADFAFLSPPKSPTCLAAHCQAGKCATSLKSARLEDDVRGDCQRPQCDDEGRLTHVDDRQDVGTAEDKQCQRRTCESGGFSLVVVTQNVSEGTECRLDDGAGACTLGRCVAAGETVPDAGPDAADTADAADAAPSDGGSDE